MRQWLFHHLLLLLLLCWLIDLERLWNQLRNKEKKEGRQKWSCLDRKRLVLCEGRKQVKRIKGEKSLKSQSGKFLLREGPSKPHENRLRGGETEPMVGGGGAAILIKASKRHMRIKSFPGKQDHCSPVRIPNLTTVV